MKLFFYIIFLSAIWAAGEDESKPAEKGLKVPSSPSKPEEKAMPVPNKPQDKEEGDKAKIEEIRKKLLDLLKENEKGNIWPDGEEEDDNEDVDDKPKSKAKNEKKEIESKASVPAKKKVSYTIKKQGPLNVKILQIANSRMRKNYPFGLRTLLEHINESSSVKLESFPETTNSFEDKAIFNFP
ncbi:MAG: hypothetical protein HRT89_05225, partial [Lentisphaeria bacterium]|nr:hypothetical protein [Lentisphaeria bacterium]NQZ67452.1 hypothetical protein [Lentisphaeria bacterium]